jgi:hypothetical protein
VDLIEAVQTGDRRQSLEALRDRLATELERVAEDGFCLECKRGSSSVAPLAKQLSDVLARLDEMPAEVKGTPLDELARRRADREPGAAGDGGAAGGAGAG